VRLEIFDQDGQLVRRFASNDLLPKTNPNDVPITTEWIHDEAPLSAEAGMQRFIWDLHDPPPPGVHRSFYGPAGPWALPGNYNVTLTADGKSTSQPLVVEMDPRVKTPREELVRQFQAASRLSATLGEVTAARQEAEDLRKKIAEGSKQAANNAELAAPLKDLDQKLAELLGTENREEFGVFGLHLPDDKPASLRQVAAALTGLLFIVQSADEAPTSDASAAIEKWRATADETLSRWKSLNSDAKSKLK
jgi:hypothetical protein